MIEVPSQDTRALRTFAAESKRSICATCGPEYGHSPACTALRGVKYLQARERIELEFGEDLKPGGILYVPTPFDWTPLKYLGVAALSCAAGFLAACLVVL